MIGCLEIVEPGQEATGTTPTRAAQAAAEMHPWIHALGPQYGREKTLLASLDRVFLMPGLVGPGALGSFICGTPMVTTDLPYTAQSATI